VVIRRDVVDEADFCSWEAGKLPRKSSHLPWENPSKAEIIFGGDQIVLGAVSGPLRNRRNDG
jgi:hypothetical protein